MKRMYISPTGMILLVLSIVPRLNGQTYEEEVLSDEPVVYYRFEESEAGEAIDDSGNDHHGEYVGGIRSRHQSAPPTGGGSSSRGGIVRERRVAAFSRDVTNTP